MKMKIKVGYTPQTEQLVHIGNKLFTKEQIKELRAI